MDRDFTNAIACKVENEKRAAGAVYDTRTVGRGEADVVFRLMGVTLEVAAVERARIDVADALVIALKIDAFADPHRPGGVAVRQWQALEITVCVCVDPDFAGGAAAVALPSRGVRSIAPDCRAAVWPV